MTNTMVFQLLTFAQAVADWPNIRPLLDRAVVHGRGELVVDDLLDLAAQDRMFFSVLKDGPKIVLALAAEVVHYPRRKVLNLAFAGGSQAKFVSDHCFDQLESMATMMGADCMQCFCRPSVARLLKQIHPGVVEAYIVLEKAVA